MKVNPVKVQLIAYTKEPYDLSIASARTCYSSKGIIYPEDVSKDEKAKMLRDKIARSTLEAGHLTTRQHPHFIFAIENISRMAVWSFLHSHPFYNSEQVSQRYVEVKPEQFYFPESLQRNIKLYEIYKNTISFQIHSYQEFIRILIPYIEKEYYNIFPYRKKQKERWDKIIYKKAMEIARYILPLATFTYLYHTISGITLYRYKKMAEVSDVPSETRELVFKMWDCINQIDPLYAKEMKDPLPIEETPEYKFFMNLFYNNQEKRYTKNFIKYFDQKLGNYYSRLVSYNTSLKEVLLDSIFSVLGYYDVNFNEEEILKYLFDPKYNIHLASTLNETMHSKLNRVLYHIHFTFQKKISHTADSQDQRHRLVPASRPYLMHQFTGDADYITPQLIRSNDNLNEIYHSYMEKIFSNIQNFLNSGATLEEACYLLPNAFPVRFYESGDLLNLIHKWKMRTCYNAQEEIFHASIQEIQQIENIFPFLKNYFRAPCNLRKRADIKPFCPEGERFCGLPVWNYDLEEYHRLI
ncbi:MAG: thymidylate synthase [Leptospiraceae bacterium]|nr:MAG: thymidylate synthase [Leptospiraceae bacterium]